MDAFKDSLDSMRICIEEHCKRSESSEIPLNAESLYIDLFIENIKKDYGNLLREEKTIIGMVEWCLKKEFYQQALTLIESHMPKEILDSGILCYNETEEIEVNYKNVVGRCNQGKKTVETIASESKNKSGMNWKSTQNFIFDRCLVKMFDPKSSGYISLNRHKPEDYVKCETKWSLEQKKARQSNGKSPIILFTVCEANDYKAKVNLKFGVKWDKVDTLNRFLQLHIALKDQRNSINHAGKGKQNSEGRSDRADIPQLKTAIAAYIGMALELKEAVVQERK